MSYIYFNPNPKGKHVTDCTIRMICLLEHMSWREAFDAVTDICREEYDMPSSDTMYPPAGQTVAIFNFPDHELCLKAKDMWGIDLGMRTFDLTETTPIAQIQGNSNQNGQVSVPERQAEPQVSKQEFDELKASLNSLIKELKG